jgi:hypothetical protein
MTAYDTGEYVELRPARLGGAAHREHVGLVGLSMRVGTAGSASRSRASPSTTTRWPRSAARRAFDAWGGCSRSRSCSIVARALRGIPCCASPFGADVIIAHYTVSGDFMWSRQLGPEGDQYGTAIAVDAGGLVTIGGIYRGGITIGADSFPDVFPDAPEDEFGTLHDGFLGFLDVAGEPTSALQLGSMLDDRIYELAFDADDILVMGAYTDEAYTLRAYADGVPGWMWTAPGLGKTRTELALADGAVIVASSPDQAVDLGAGPTTPRGGGDLLLARVRR